MPLYEAKSIINDEPTFEKRHGQIVREFSDLLISCKHGEAIEVNKISREDCISKQQNAWLHCPAGPIMYLVDHGWDFEGAKRFFKVKFGRKIFVREMTDDNCNKLKGYFFWECRAAICRKIVHPWKAILGSSYRICPHCHNELYPIILRSINNVAVSRINLWYDAIFVAYPEIKPPNPDWKKKKDDKDV